MEIFIDVYSLVLFTGIDQMVLKRNRRAIYQLNWSHMGQCFVLDRSPVILPRNYKKSRNHFLLACQVRHSRIRNAGFGVFIRETASTGQILLKYGGRKISLPEADQLVEKVNHLKLEMY